MKFLRGKREIIDDEPNDGLVRAYIEIKRINRGTRKVIAKLNDCSTGKTIYKATYETSAKTDFFAFEHAKEDLKRHMSREDFVLYGEFGTNVELPGIVTTSKRMR